jgi:hypothetical protein
MKRVPDGTTLLELVVALAATGIILSAGFGLADQIFRTTAEDPTTQAAFNAAELRRSLSSWFGNPLMELDGAAYPFTGTSAPAPQVQALLVSAAPYTPREVIAKLFVDNTRLAPGGGLIIQLTDPLDLSSRTLQLERDVSAMKVRYLIHTGSEAVWTEVYASSSEPPRAMEITLLPRAGSRLHHILELPVLIPVGFQ